MRALVPLLGFVLIVAAGVAIGAAWGLLGDQFGWARCEGCDVVTVNGFAAFVGGLLAVPLGLGFFGWATRRRSGGRAGGGGRE